MSDKDITAILDSLMARRGKTPEFTLELEGYLDDLVNGELDTVDKKYIRELAKRLGGGDGGEPIEPDDHEEADSGEPIEPDDHEEADSGDTRFARAKSAFHVRFHPDNIDPDATDAALRRELYEEFSAELDRIEDEG